MTLSTFTTRWSAVALTTGAAAALVIGGAALPASADTAAPIEILVSNDGVHFAPTLTDNLFLGADHLIPGGSVTETFWVKNPTAAAAAMRISATEVHSSNPAYAALLTLSTWDSGSGETAEQDLGAVEGCDILVPSQQVGAGETVKVTLALTLDSAVTGTTGQGETADVGVRVAMRDAAVGAFPPSACGDGGIILPPTTKPDPDPTATPTPKPTTAPSSTTTPAPAAVGTKKDLAGTGADANTPLLIGGALLLGGGMFFVVRRFRRGADKL